MNRKKPVAKQAIQPTKAEEAPSSFIEQSDLQALRDARAGVEQAQAIFQAFQNFVANKYKMGPSDSLDLGTGKLSRGVL